METPKKVYSVLGALTVGGFVAAWFQHNDFAWIGTLGVWVFYLGLLALVLFSVVLVVSRKAKKA